MADHVLLHDQSLVCTHCGAEYEIRLPCPVRLFQDLLHAFMEAHAGCRKVEAPHA